MNRVGHTLSGVAAGVWSLPVAPITGAAGSVVWVAAVTGFALAPDLDHPASTAARMWGPVSQWPAKIIGSVFGHRGATHRVAADAAARPTTTATTCTAIRADSTTATARTTRPLPTGPRTRSLVA